MQTRLSPFALVVAIIAAATVTVTVADDSTVLLSRGDVSAAYQQDALAFTPAQHPQYLPLDLADVPKASNVCSYYEFTQPKANRLTDEAWRDMLASGTLLPARPAWTRSFRQPVEVEPVASPTGDRDGDGMTDCDEYAAGTDPDDPHP